MKDNGNACDTTTTTKNMESLRELCLEKTCQMITIVMALLTTATVSYFAGPMRIVMYLVVAIVPLTLVIGMFPRILCLNFRGTSFTSKSSDISWSLLYWGYWVLLNYTFFLAEFNLRFSLWCVVPLDLLLFALALLSRYSEYAKALLAINVVVILFPFETVGIFREESYVTIVRVLLYFSGFYFIEFCTKTTGVMAVPYLSWLLHVWKWLLLLFIFQIAYVLVSDYLKRRQELLPSAYGSSSPLLPLSQPSSSSDQGFKKQGKNKESTVESHPPTTSKSRGGSGVEDRSKFRSDQSSSSSRDAKAKETKPKKQDRKDRRRETMEGDRTPKKKKKSKEKKRTISKHDSDSASGDDASSSSNNDEEGGFDSEEEEEETSTHTYDGTDPFAHDLYGPKRSDAWGSRSGIGGLEGGVKTYYKLYVPNNNK